MTPPRVLMASPNYWTSPFQVGSQHLARAFSRAGWQVAFVSDPISPLHKLAGAPENLRARTAIHRAGGLVDPEHAVWTYVPWAILTPHHSPLLRSRQVHRGWHRLTVPPVVQVVREAGFGEVDLLYLDSAVQRFWLEAIPHARSVQRVADRTTGFARYTPEMRRMEAEVARTVDVVAYTALTLEAYVRELGATRILHLPNGIDYDRYRQPMQPPEDLAMLRRPIAIYVGAMDTWFDFDTLGAMADALPDVSFVLIGPDDLARQRLSGRANLHVLGRRDHRAIPAYLQHADVGLIPFDVRGHGDLVNGVHPLKLYEYLACGLPVVATEWEELRALRAPVRLCRTKTEHIDAVRELLTGPPDPTIGLEYAAGADWQSRLETLLDRVFQGSPPT